MAKILDRENGMEDANEFDEIVSLGYNCEVSFRIKDVFGEVTSYLYTWAYCFPPYYSWDSLKNIQDVFCDHVHLLQNGSGMFLCEKYSMAFHARDEFKKTLFDKNNEKSCKSAIAELKDRLNHLKEKTEDLFTSEKRTLFVLKVNSDNEGIKEIIQNLYEIVDKKYVSKDYLIVVVLENKALNEDILALQCDRLKIFGIERYADNDATDSSGDLEGWKKILGQYKKASISTEIKGDGNPRSPLQNSLIKGIHMLKRTRKAF